MSRAVASGHHLTVKSALVIDDHPLYCDALAMTMEGIFNTRRIRTATCLEEALRLLRAPYCPDLVMLDLNLPDVSGTSGFIKIKRRIPDVPVIVTSAVATDAVIHAVMQAGATGFIPKDIGREAFKQAMIDIGEGKIYLPPGYSRTASTALPEDTSGDAISAKIASLSAQQTRILSLICEGKQNKMIAYEMQLAEATVKAHITALLRRLGVRSRTQAALMVREVSIRHSLQ
ncbi:response regulator [Roseibium aestuarii]|uniref:Response regulator n=1 Tax=Roseibium aestuarii TaxID=2600299 RepID=A0ABW4JX43_9HYPH|nr:response regulator transcription factor [Roseibium aestuarii]